ncbi:MAG: RDD family protein [Spirochaetota bacterium]
MSQGEQRSGSQYAGFFTRTLAFWIDFVFCVLLMTPVWWWFIVGLTGEHSGVFLLGWSKIVLAGWLLLRWLYLSVGWSTRLGTLGGRLVSIEVAASSGTRLSFLRSLLRCFALLLSWSVFGLGWLPMLFSHRHRALHDWIAGTDVVGLSHSRQGGRQHN